jgi:hypothetical protein
METLEFRGIFLGSKQQPTHAIASTCGKHNSQSENMA